jgi:stearoyl-CoA desaturase (delta-9 desaturase)
MVSSSIKTVTAPPPIAGIFWGGPAVLIKRVENAALIGIPFAGSVAALVWSAEHGLTVVDVYSFLIFYFLTGLGVALGMHRYFTHRSFKTALPIQLLLGAFATMSFQGSILRWVVDHRRHHAHADVEGDVHSPHMDPWGQEQVGIAGFWYAHVGWMFDGTATDPALFGHDLVDDPVVMFFTRTHWIWLIAALALPYGFGYALGGPDGAWSSMLFGGCLKTTVLHNVVWGVNSVGHSHGNEDFPQANKSKNNLVLALLTFGDGWHNNHHRFPRSAFHGLTPRELDVNGWIITGLERLGLAWDVVRIPQQRIDAARRASMGGVQC